MGDLSLTMKVLPVKEYDFFSWTWEGHKLSYKYGKFSISGAICYSALGCFAFALIFNYSSNNSEAEKFQN